MDGVTTLPSTEILYSWQLGMNFTADPLNPTDLTIKEKLFSPRESTRLSESNIFKGAGTRENISQESYLSNWDGPTLGFGIPDTPQSTHIVNCIIGIILVTIGVVGTSGNGLVLYVFTRYRRLRGGGGPLILSLASGDFFVSVIHALPAFSSFYNKWAFGSYGCYMYAASVGLCGIASLLTLSAIAADRFSVIVGRPLPWLAGKKTCTAIWAMSACLTFPPFFGWSRYCLEGMGTSCSWDYTSRDFNNRLYYIFLLVIGFLVPVSIIIVSYLGILWVVWKQRVPLNASSVGAVLMKKRPTQNDVKTAKVILTIIICFLTAWTPYAVVSLIGQFGDETKALSPLGTALPAIFAKTSVIFNPIVYSLSHPHFRSAMRTLRARPFGNKKSRKHHHHIGNNKEYYQYRYPQSIQGNRYPSSAIPKKCNLYDEICSKSGERLRRETRRQRETWTKQQSTSTTKMMSELTTTSQNNKTNLNMLVVVPNNHSFMQEHFLVFENSRQEIQSISKYCSEHSLSR